MSKDWSELNLVPQILWEILLDILGDLNWEKQTNKRWRGAGRRNQEGAIWQSECDREEAIWVYLPHHCYGLGGAGFGLQET